MKLFIVKNLNGTIKPAHDSDYDLLKKLKVNEIYKCEIVQPRNLAFHKKFFALIKMLYDNQDRYSNIDHLRHDLIIEAGYYELRYNIHGVEIYEPKSISFANMKQDEFDKLYSAVVDVIVKYFNFDREDIAQNVEQFF